MRLQPRVNGKKSLQTTYEFNNDLGSALNEYAGSVVNMSLDDRQSQVSKSSTALPARSDREAANELKIVVSNGSVFLLNAALQYVHVDARDHAGRTALSYASEWGKYDIAKVLLEEGASVSTRQWSRSGWDDNYDPFLFSGATPIWWAAKKGRTNVVDLLLRHGANPNARTTSGRTPLMEACQRGYVNIARLLLSKKADINSQSYNDVCVLFISLASQANMNVSV